MGTLNRFLPAFATDYSGAAALLSDLGGLVAISAPSGCMGNFTGFDEPRWFSDPRHVYLLRMNEFDSIFGETARMVTELSKTVRCLHPPFVAVVRTPVSSMIGLDLESVAKRVESDTGVPSFAVNTDGYGTHHDGIRQATDALLGRCEDVTVSSDKGIGIIGYTPLEHLPQDMTAIEKIIISSGYQANVFPAGGIFSLSTMIGAERNIVISVAGLPFAKRVEHKYGVPWNACLPIGEIGKELLQDVLKRKDKRDALSVAGGDILIIGEQVRANAIRRHIACETGHGAVVGSLFSFDRDLALPGDGMIGNETEAIRVIDDGYSCVIADPFFKSMIPDGSDFIADPCPAVSSRVWRHQQRSIDDPVWLTELSRICMHRD